jgi:MFS family permease
LRGAYSRDARADASLRASMRDGGAYSVMVGAGETYFTAYALLYHATSAQISLLAALPAAIGAGAQLASAWLARAIRGRLTLILGGVALQIAAWPLLIWLPYFLPAQAVPLLIACVALYYAGGHLAAPPWNSLMGDLVPERRRGRFFGRRTRIMSVVSFSAMLAGGLILHLFEARAETRLGFTLVFLLAAGARVYSWAQLARMHEPPHASTPLTLPSFATFTARLRTSDFARFTLFFAAMNFAAAITSPFFAVYQLRDLQFTYLEFTISTGTAVMAQFASLGLWGRFADAYGNRLVMRLTGTIIPILPALWLISPNFFYIVALQVAGGLCWAGFSLAAGNYLYDAVPREKRTSHAAIHQVLANLGVFTGALLGGYLTTVIPAAVHVGSWELGWPSSLWGVMLLSALARFAVSSAFLPALRELRVVRPMSAAGLLVRLVRISAITGLLSEMLFERRPPVARKNHAR